MNQRQIIRDLVGEYMDDVAWHTIETMGRRHIYALEMAVAFGIVVTEPNFPGVWAIDLLMCSGLAACTNDCDSESFNFDPIPPTYILKQSLPAWDMQLDGEDVLAQQCVGEQEAKCEDMHK